MRGVLVAAGLVGLAVAPLHAADRPAPAESQGIMSTEDSALVVRATFMARPGDLPYVIRREASNRILKAFAEQGITFAHRQVTVFVPPGGAPQAAAGAAAAVAPAAGVP